MTRTIRNDNDSYRVVSENGDTLGFIRRWNLRPDKAVNATGSRRFRATTIGGANEEDFETLAAAETFIVSSVSEALAHKPNRDSSMRRSINQIAQDEGDTGANEANRIRARESAVKQAWYRVSYNEGAAACTADRIAAESELPAEFVSRICEVNGLALR